MCQESILPGLGSSWSAVLGSPALELVGKECVLKYRSPGSIVDQHKNHGSGTQGPSRLTNSLGDSMDIQVWLLEEEIGMRGSPRTKSQPLLHCWRKDPALWLCRPSQVCGIKKLSHMRPLPCVFPMPFSLAFMRTNLYFSSLDWETYFLTSPLCQGVCHYWSDDRLVFFTCKRKMPALPTSQGCCKDQIR